MQNDRWWHPEGLPEPDGWDDERGLPVETYVETSDLFHIGQSYEKKPATVIACRTCKGRRFEVGRGSYFTAIRCVKCGWEYGIHSG